MDFTNANKCMAAQPGTLWCDATGYWLVLIPKLDRGCSLGQGWPPQQDTH